MNELVVRRVPRVHPKTLLGKNRRDNIVIQMYHKWVPIEEIMKYNNLSVTTIHAILRKYNIPKRGFLSKAIENEIMKMYLANVPLKEIEKKFGISDSTIHRIRRDFKILGRGKLETIAIQKNKDKIIELYQSGLTTAQVGKRLKMPEVTVLQNLKNWGIPRRTYIKVDPVRLLKLYKMGASPKELAATFGVSSSDIYKHLVEKFGIHHTKKVKFKLEEDNLLRYTYGTRGLSVPIVTKILNKTRIRAAKLSDTIVRRRIKELNIKQGNYIEVTNDELNSLLGMIKTNLSLEEVSEKLQIPTVTITKIWQQYGKGKRIPREKKHFSKTEVDEQARRIRFARLQTRATVEDIAKTLGISTSQVARVIREYKIPYVKKVFNAAVRGRIKELYDSNMHYRDIAKKLGLKTESVRTECRRMGLPSIGKPWGKKYPANVVTFQNNLIKKYYLKPYYFSIHTLSKRLGLDRTTIKDRLQKMRIPVRGMLESRRVGKIKLGKARSKTLQLSPHERRFLNANRRK